MKGRTIAGTAGAGRPARQATRTGPAAVVAVLVVLAVAAGAAAAGRGRESQGFSTGPLEAQTHELVNAHRRDAGLRPLEYSPAIAAVARRHSEAMAAGKVRVGHQGAAERERRIAREIPLRGMAENVAVNNAAARRTARMAVAGWLGSRGHRANIVGDYDVTGIGIARGRNGAWYFTHIFVKRAGGGSARPPPR